MDPYVLTLAFVGAAILGAALLPMLLAGRPLSFPVVYVALGMAVFALPLRLPSIDPLAEGDVVERMTELAVIGFPGGRATLLETAPGVTVRQVREATQADLAVSEHVSTMAL